MIPDHLSIILIVSSFLLMFIPIIVEKSSGGNDKKSSAIELSQKVILPSIVGLSLFILGSYLHFSNHSTDETKMIVITTVAASGGIFLSLVTTMIIFLRIRFASS